MAGHRIVLSWGLGRDSTALLLRWITEPATRPCPLRDLLLITAQTGDEWPATGELVTRYMLPLLREHAIRWVQVARRGPKQEEGVAILADTRSPARVYLDGAYTLGDEMTAAGTIPQSGGRRTCSLKAKGWPIDTFLAAELGDATYTHVMGFEAGEAGRPVRDARYNTEQRTGTYPLLDWGWTGTGCEDYIEQHLGTRWLKSACVYCPFALQSRDGRDRVMPLYRQAPALAARGLIMEHLAVSLNPRQGLAGGKRLSELLAREPGQEATLAEFRRQLDGMDWNLYEMRRAMRAPAKGSRCLQILDSGGQADMTAALHRRAATEGLLVVREGGIERAWRRRRGIGFPDAEWLYVAAPAGAEDKTGRGFAAAWAAAEAGPPQQALWEGPA